MLRSGRWPAALPPEALGGPRLPVQRLAAPGGPWQPLPAAASRGLPLLRTLTGRRTWRRCWVVSPQEPLLGTAAKTFPKVLAVSFWGSYFGGVPQTQPTGGSESCAPNHSALPCPLEEPPSDCLSGAAGEDDRKDWPALGTPRAPQVALSLIPVGTEPCRRGESLPVNSPRVYGFPLSTQQYRLEARCAGLRRASRGPWYWGASPGAGGTDCLSSSPQGRGRKRARHG